MTTRTTLLALAERVEAATAGDRELDAEIAVAAGGFRRTSKSVLSKGQWDYACEGDSYFIAWPAYTASLDAAMSLVPSGCAWSVEAILSLPEPFHAVVSDGLWLSRSTTPSIAATPALALTAACLRSRAIAGSMTDD